MTAVLGVAGAKNPCCDRLVITLLPEDEAATPPVVGHVERELWYYLFPSLLLLPFFPFTHIFAINVSNNCDCGHIC